MRRFFPMPTRLAWKVWQRNRDVFFKTYLVNFLPPFVEPVLYLLALGYGLGLFVGEIDGVPYVSFIAPALLAISMMNSSFFECTYSSFVRMYYQKAYDAMVATPLSIEDVIAGELLWGATRSLIYTTAMLVVLIAFGVVALPSSLLVIPFSFLAGLLFSGIAMCFTAISPSIDTLNYPAFLFITPMFLFSGTFFPLSVLPGPIQVFAMAKGDGVPVVHPGIRLAASVPVQHCVDRGCLHGPFLRLDIPDEKAACCLGIRGEKACRFSDCHPRKPGKDILPPASAVCSPGEILQQGQTRSGQCFSSPGTKRSCYGVIHGSLVHRRRHCRHADNVWVRPPDPQDDPDTVC